MMLETIRNVSCSVMSNTTVSFFELTIVLSEFNRLIFPVIADHRQSILPDHKCSVHNTGVLGSHFRHTTSKPLEQALH